MNPVCIRIFDIKRSKTASSHFCDMCLTDGEDAAIASTIFAVIEELFAADVMPWNNFVSLT